MRSKPRILIVTPEITYLPQGMGNMANVLTAKAGGLADVSAALVSALFDLGADVHVALPHYRRMFAIDVGRLINDELRMFRSRLPNTRIHLAEDRVFYYRNSVYGYDHVENPKIALAFQREVINNILPEVQPDLIHCNDWMTGLIPAMARRMNIPCLMTVHNIHTYDSTLSAIEDSGVDAAVFWKYLYFKRVPSNYEESRDSNLVDLLASGIFGSHFINTVSPTFLHEVVDGRHDFVPPQIRQEMAQKLKAGCAFGILNAPDPSFDPARDTNLAATYTADTHIDGKLANKLAFQERAGLRRDPHAPIFFWPSRLDPIQKGCQLLTDILYRVISRYWKDNLQVALVANGPYQKHFRDILRHHDFYGRVAVCDFDEGLSHLAYAASDFCLMPSRFEPCGLPQMISALYGTLTVAHDTGGLHDTVHHLDVSKDRGNGFVFETYDSNGLSWAMDQAMAFYHLPAEVRRVQLARVMRESATEFNHGVAAKRYIDMYEQMLQRPLVQPF
ncbi:MAG: glycogen synthase [Lentisphaerae bacterium RIFOXYC12_FULL_60_16]|nr:MAG: glycogen synthase [Lentisphaerae bacterium RIFOXYC12_FULL_60_16]OGV75771.1 MAG: glycogen synthase [Lentisphaerae bacterium RIFOXYB12_FULL_60_10]